MNDLKHDPELPFVAVGVSTREVFARFSNLEGAVSFSDDGPYVVEVIDTTPKPKIPEDAEYIIWEDPYDNGEERIARRYGHPANKVWRVDEDTLDELELLNEWIGDSEVTVLVRKEES